MRTIRSIHVQLHNHIADFNFYIHDNSFQKLFEEIDRSILTNFSLNFMFFNIKFVKFMDLDHFLFKIFREILIGFKGDLNIRNIDLDALGRNL